MPFFLSWVIVYNILQVFLQGETGLINVFLRDLGLINEGIGFLSDPRYSWGLVVFSNLWKTLGYNAVIYLAAIAGIDTGLYEAASIDGADRLQRIRYITVPLLMPTFQILLILNVGWIFASNFDQYYLFTNSMNRPTMEVFDMYIYRFGLRQLDFSYATAVGVLRSIAGFILLIIVNNVSKKIQGSSVA
jgi:putative aldouronate transport system permease protein